MRAIVGSALLQYGQRWVHRLESALFTLRPALLSRIGFVLNLAANKLVVS